MNIVFVLFDNVTQLDFSGPVQFLSRLPGGKIFVASKDGQAVTTDSGFSILPGIVQPEPFILLAWTMAALLALRALRAGGDPQALLGAGVLLGVGLSLHPQGLSFLLLALVLCLLPWTNVLVRHLARLVAPMLGALCVLLPVAAAESTSFCVSSDCRRKA